jgi:hypothetical protein
MATTAFGRRNVAHRAPSMPAAASASARGIAPEPAAFVLEQVAEFPQQRTVKPGSPLKAMLGALFMIAGAVFLVFMFAADLQRDISLQDTFRPDLRVKVERSECRRYAFVVSHCSVRFSWHDGATKHTADGSFLVGLKSMDGVRVIPVRSTADPSVVTSAVALVHLSNRTWTLALFSGASLLLGLLVLMKLRRRA